MSSYYTYDSNLRDRNKFTSTVQTTFGTKRYFSSLDTEVYFGSKQIDEIVAIDFVIGEPKLPIYGFNSFYANRIISGRRTIQGTFAINFTHTLDLLKVLESIEDSVLKAEYPVANGTTLDYEALTFRCEGEDSTGLGIGNSAIFRKMFDITLSYGYAKTEGMQTYNCSYQTLVGVQITDYRQALDTEGNPILDMYSFIAKDLRFQESVSTASESQTKTTPEAEATPTCPKCKEPLVSCKCQEETEKYVTANEKNAKEMSEFNEQTKNSNMAGFKINATFNYTPPGSHAASAYPYLRLYIDGVNNETEKFTEVLISFKGHNISIPLKDIKDGGFVIHEFKDSTRDLGVTLRKSFTENESHVAKATLEFIAIIEGNKVAVKAPTEIHLGSVLY